MLVCLTWYARAFNIIHTEESVLQTTSISLGHLVELVCLAAYRHVRSCKQTERLFLSVVYLCIALSTRSKFYSRRTNTPIHTFMYEEHHTYV